MCCRPGSGTAGSVHNLSVFVRHALHAPVQADICQLGMDQRKVNVLAREYCDKIRRKLKPVILSHEMLPGLLEVRARTRRAAPQTGMPHVHAAALT